MPEELDMADARVAMVAAQQHGIASIRQLREAGLSDDAVLTRVRAGRLHRLYRGVYAVGHRGLSEEGRWMAAVLVYGKRAVLSHRSAAALWGLLRPMAGAIDVSVVSRSGRSKRAGITLHRCPSLGIPGSREASPLVTERKGIPVTSPVRTLDDLRGIVPDYLVRRATRQAEFAKLIDPPGSDRTRSDLERDFLRLCRRHGIPAPEVNVRVGRLTVDFLWCRERVAVETDGYAYHRGQIAFQDDRARDLELRRHGFEVRRYSELQVNEAAAEIAADLREALSVPQLPRPAAR
jgi:very-short-patch-repair endonuclease